MSEGADARWTDEDTEALFAVLGKYWVIFQWIEAQLDKLLLLAWGHDNWAAGQGRLARMSNAQKVERVKSIVLTAPDFARVHSRPEWVSHFTSVMDALHSERKRRNSLIHSQILFELADKGLGPPLLSARTKNADQAFDQQWLSKEFSRKC